MKLQRSSILFLTLAAASVVLGLWILKSQLMNPMEAREANLESEIANIETRPIFYIAPANIDYAELDAQLKAHPGVWRELVPAAAAAAPVAAGPNFTELLAGVVAGNVMGLGDTLKIRVVTPAKPRGYWVKVGDSINGATIVEITATDMVFEKIQNNKPYKYALPR